MHPIMAIKHWNQYLHESMMHTSHQIREHLHSRHFWAGVGATLLIIGGLAVLFTLITKTPLEDSGTYPYGFPNKNYF
jgi:Fe2+ transport system protein B